MKKIGVASIWSLIFFCACVKNENLVKPVPISALTIVNASIGSSPVAADFNGDSIQWFSDARTIGYGSSYEYSMPSGRIITTLYQMSDTMNGVYYGFLDLEPAGIYSLFLCGQAPQSGKIDMDTLFINDNPPYYSASDSVTGVRFVNLSFGSNPISVNIQGMQSQPIVKSLAYKSLTGFTAFPATATNPVTKKYIFEFRDASSGTLITTYSYSSIQRFKNVTIALKGLAGVTTGVSAQGAFLINNF